MPSTSRRNEISTVTENAAAYVKNANRRMVENQKIIDDAREAEAARVEERRKEKEQA